VRVQLGRPVDPDVYERELIRRKKVDRVIDDDEEGKELRALQQKIDLRNEFTKLTDRKVRARVARSKVKDQMHIYEFSVDQRRERLAKISQTILSSIVNWFWFVFFH